MDYWGQVKDIASFWLGWQVLDWLRALAVGAIVSIGGWLIARMRQSAWQRELRGAAIGFIALMIVVALVARQRRPNIESPPPQHTMSSASATDAVGTNDKAQACVTAPPPTPSAREMLEAKGLSFSEQFVYNLRWDFLRLPRPCNLKILAPPGMEAPRGQLVSAAMNASVQILNRPNGYYVPVCEIIDEQKDRMPLLYGPRNFPPFGIIHTSESNIETREFLAEVFRSQSISVTGDSVLPPNSPANLIYIEFGRSLIQGPK